MMKISGKILLVEDDRITSAAECRILKNQGYNVLPVHGGEKAVEIALQDSSINLILMDIDLGPGMDGTETARKILSEKNIPIVFLTSHSEKEMVDRIRKITRYGYILKNSGAFVLISSINMAFELFEALDRVRREQESFRKLYESIAGGILVVNNDYIIEDVNDITCEISGYKKEELIGELCDKLCPKGSESKKCPIWAEKTEGFTCMNTFIKCRGNSRIPILKNARRMTIGGRPMIFENFQHV